MALRVRRHPTRTTSSSSTAARVLHSKRTEMSTTSLSLLLLLLCICCGGFVCEAVNVGDAEVHRHLISSGSGSSGDESDTNAGKNGSCPDVTTASIYAPTEDEESATTLFSARTSSTASTAQIVNADCERVIVETVATTTANTGSGNEVRMVLLDLHGKGIAQVESVPSDVQIL